MSRPMRWGLALVGIIAVGLLAFAILPATVSGAPGSAQPGPTAAVAGSATTGQPDRTATPGHGTAGTTTTTTPAAAPVAWVEQSHSLSYGGRTRSYIVFRPAGAADTDLPVVVALAGCCESAQYEASRMDFRELGHPAILVYPQYIDGHWDAGACCGSAASDGIDDVGFIDAVINQVKAVQPGASPGPVYLAGYSNGGKMALRLACTHPARFAAVAVFGATETWPCTGPPALSVLEMAGTSDPEVALTGKPVVQDGYTEPTVAAVVSSFRTADGCSPSSSTTISGSLSEHRWSCAAGRRVALAVYQGVTHTWPQATATTPSGQNVMWTFFTSVGA